MHRINTRQYVYGAFFLALGVVLPQIFHITGIAGSIFLPMHIPVMLAGMLACPLIGLYVGTLAPVISYLMTGMPPVSPPIMPMMIIELGAYGFVAGFLYRILKKNVYTSLVLSMVVGRLALGASAYVLMRFFGFRIDPVVYVKGAVVTGLPGMAIQLVLVPVLVMMVNRVLAPEEPLDSSGVSRKE